MSCNRTITKISIKIIIQAILIYVGSDGGLTLTKQNLGRGTIFTKRNISHNFFVKFLSSKIKKYKTIFIDLDS